MRVISRRIYVQQSGATKDSLKSTHQSPANQRNVGIAWWPTTDQLFGWEICWTQALRSWNPDIRNAAGKPINTQNARLLLYRPIGLVRCVYHIGL